MNIIVVRVVISAVARQGRKGRLPLPKKIIKIFHEKMKEGVIKVTIFLKNNSNRDYDLKSQNFLGQWPLILFHNESLHALL